MSALAAWLAFAAALNVQVAPDQPLPYVYMDEPLIVEFTASEASQVSGAVVIVPPHGARVRHPLDGMTLRAHDVRWFPVELPRESLSGPHMARFELEVNGAPLEFERPFCRINRPGARTPSPFLTTLDEIDQEMVLTLQAIPIGEVRLRFSGGGAGLLGQAAKAGLAVTPVITSPGEAAQFLDGAGEGAAAPIERWELAISRRRDAAAALDAIRASGSEAPVYLRVSEPGDLAPPLLQLGIDGLAVDSDGWDGEARAAFVRAHQEMGYEGIPRYACGRGVSPQDGSPSGGGVARFALERLAWGFFRSTVDGRLIYDGARFGPAFGYLGALAHRLGGLEYLGPLQSDVPVRIEVFRRGGAWTAAVWATADGEGAEVVVELPVAEGAGVALYDALGNRLPHADAGDGVVRVAAGSDPSYIVSEGGPLIERVAAQGVRREAEAFVGDDRFTEEFPEAVIELVEPYAAGGAGDDTSRERFLGLLRLFVFIERERMEGELSTEAAIPASGALARLARYLCVMEQARGEPFVELLPKTLANCRDFQLQYVATAGAAKSGPFDRGPWLLGEVRRLCAEAVELDELDRPIEAAAVARLAEWRARSLENARPPAR